LAGLRPLQKRPRLWLLRWSGFSDRAEAILENVWQNVFTCWIEIVKCLNCPFLFFYFSLLFSFFPSPFSASSLSYLFNLTSFLSIHHFASAPPPRASRSHLPSVPPPRLLSPRLRLRPCLLAPARPLHQGQSSKGGGRAGWSHVFVALPPQWKPFAAPSPISIPIPRAASEHPVQQGSAWSWSWSSFWSPANRP
jgi:hypothetical protein